ncbi:MAG: hypothetical protein AB1352_00120 [Patescibacteria group bacterium]
MSPWFSILVGLVRRHSVAFLIAFCVGMVTVLPQVMQRIEEGNAYRGIVMRGTDTEEYYLIRIREAYDGHLTLASPDLYEYKQAPYVQPPLPEIVMAGAARVLGMSVPPFVAVSKFLLPFLLALVLYALVRWMTGNMVLALAVSPAVILVGQTAVSGGALLQLLRLNLGAFSSMVDYARPISPQFTSLLFFLWLVFWYTWLRNPGKRVWFCAGAVTLGLLVYVYLFAWLLAMGITLLMLFVSLLPRVRTEGVRFLKVGAYFILSLLVTIPYWINSYHVFTRPLYDVLQKRYGFYASREPLWSDLLALDLVLVVGIYWKKKKNETFTLLLTWILSIFILTNQQVITGLRFYPGHWHWYYTTPLTIFVLLWIVCEVVRRWPRVQVAFAVFVIMGSIGVGVMKQTIAFARLRASSAAEQRLAGPLQWLQYHTKKDDVVMASGGLNELVPIYTHANAYFSRWGEFYLVPHERFRDRMFARLYLNGAREDTIAYSITADNKDVYEYLFGRFRLRRGECAQGCFTPLELQGVKDEYLAWLKEVDFEQFLRKYRLDYAAWDVETSPQWRLDQYPFFEFIEEMNGVRMYRMKDERSQVSYR